MKYIKPDKIIRATAVKQIYSGMHDNKIFPGAIYTNSKLIQKLSRCYRWDKETCSLEKNTVEFDNEPCVGFSLTHVTQSNQAVSSIVIKDPRGFHVNITPGNIAQITLNAIISHGLICNKCVWVFGEQSNEPYLALEGTELFDIATERTRQLTTKISKEQLDDLKTGDLVLLKNGKQAYVFLGKDFATVSTLIQISEDNTESLNLFDIKSNKLMYAFDKESFDARYDKNRYLWDERYIFAGKKKEHYYSWYLDYVGNGLVNLQKAQIVEKLSGSIANREDFAEIVNDMQFLNKTSRTENTRYHQDSLIGKNHSIELVNLYDETIRLANEKLEYLVSNLPKNTMSLETLQQKATEYFATNIQIIDQNEKQYAYIPQLHNYTKHQKWNNGYCTIAFQSLNSNTVQLQNNNNSHLLEVALSDQNINIVENFDKLITMYKTLDSRYGSSYYSYNNLRHGSGPSQNSVKHEYIVNKPEDYKKIKLIRIKHEILGKTFYRYL